MAFNEILYCIQREVFVVIFECTDFFFNILNNERYHLRVLKSQNIYLEGIHARFKLLLLTNIFTYMPSFFFQMQSSCTFYTRMHFLLIISMVIALIPIFHANFTVDHIKKSMQSISWIFWLRIKGDVLKDLMSRGLTMEIALWLAADQVRWKSLQSSCLKHLMVQRVLREREIQVTHVFFSYISMNQYIYTSLDI